MLDCGGWLALGGGGHRDKASRREHRLVVCVFADEALEFGNRLVEFPLIKEIAAQLEPAVGFVDDDRAPLGNGGVRLSGRLQLERKIPVRSRVRVTRHDGLPEPDGRLVFPIAMNRRHGEWHADDRDRDRRGCRNSRAAQQRSSDDDRQHDDGGQRQIHAAFGARLAADGDEARCGRKNDEEPRAEKAPHGAPDQRRHRTDQQQHDQSGRGRDGPKRERLRHAVVEHQRPRPDRQAQVACDHYRLIQKVRPDGDARREPG